MVAAVYVSETGNCTFFKLIEGGKKVLAHIDSFEAVY